MRKLPVSGSPAPGIRRSCAEAATKTALPVYCPPVVPVGPAQGTGPHGREFKGDVVGRVNIYSIEFRSASLVQSRRAFEKNPYQGHWLIAAARPAHRLADAVDPRRATGVGAGTVPPGLKHQSEVIGRVRVTLLSGDTSSAGLASAGHVVAYWRVGNLGYLVSVHDLFRPRPKRRSEKYVQAQSSRYLPIVERMARGLIKETHDCSPSPAGSTRTSRSLLPVGCSGL